MTNTPFGPPLPMPKKSFGRKLWGGVALDILCVLSNYRRAWHMEFLDRILHRDEGGAGMNLNPRKPCSSENARVQWARQQ
jgi:hypothetical protein